MFRWFYAFSRWPLDSFCLRHPPHGHAPAPSRHLGNVLDCSRPTASFWARSQPSRKYRTPQQRRNLLRRTRRLSRRATLQPIPRAHWWTPSHRGSRAIIFISTSSLPAPSPLRIPKSIFFLVARMATVAIASNRTASTSSLRTGARMGGYSRRSATALDPRPTLAHFCRNCAPCVTDAMWPLSLAFSAAPIHLS